MFLVVHRITLDLGLWLLYRYLLCPNIVLIDFSTLRNCALFYRDFHRDLNYKRDARRNKEREREKLKERRERKIYIQTRMTTSISSEALLLL